MKRHSDPIHYYVFSADAWQLIKTYKTQSGARRAAIRDGELGYSSLRVHDYTFPGEPPPVLTGGRVARLPVREILVYAVHE